jgi:hypothetical protein
MGWSTLASCSSSSWITWGTHTHNQDTDTDRGKPKQNSAHLIYDRIEDFSSKQISRYRQLSVDEANAGVVWVFDVEAVEVEHVVCENIVWSGALSG